jgi:hypothetical protein
LGEERLKAMIHGLRLFDHHEVPGAIHDVDRVAVTWLALAIAEGVCHRPLTKGLDSFEEDQHQKQVERAQKRHLVTVKTLAQILKLGGGDGASQYWREANQFGGDRSLTVGRGW